MLEFVEAARIYLSTTCRKCRLWVDSAAIIAARDDPILSDVMSNELLMTNMLQELILCVQRVIIRHKNNSATTEQNESQ